MPSSHKHLFLIFSSRACLALRRSQCTFLFRFIFLLLVHVTCTSSGILIVVILNLQGIQLEDGVPGVSSCFSVTKGRQIIYCIGLSSVVVLILLRQRFVGSIFTLHFTTQSRLPVLVLRDWCGVTCHLSDIAIKCCTIGPHWASNNLWHNSNGRRILLSPYSLNNAYFLDTWNRLIQYF